MNAVQAIGRGVTALAGGLTAGLSSAQTTNSSGFSQGDFLDLLITQITHQNPMEPMSNETMVTQMAQFQTVEKLNSLDDKMGSLLVYQNLMGSINLLGKNVTVFDSEAGKDIVGKVEGIKIEEGFPGVVVNGKFYDIGWVTNVSQ